MTTKRPNGFTIVELLIVIVVIGILAAIVIVSYQGITKRANDVAVQADFANNVKKLEIYRLDNNAYPAGSTWQVFNPAIAAVGFSFTKTAYAIQYGPTNNDANILYVNNNDGEDFAIIARSKSGKVFYYSSKEGAVKEYPNPSQFPGHSGDIKTALGMNSTYPGWGVGGDGIWSVWVK